MIDRYKKTGGFIQLLQLIETCGPKKQEQFLGLIKEDSEVWEQAIKQKMLTVDKVLNWDLAVLGEVLSRVHFLNLAVVLLDVPLEKRRTLISVFSQTEQRKIEELIQEQRPTQPEKLTYASKFLSETRNLIAQGYIKLEKADPNLVIPNNIEALLEEESSSQTTKREPTTTKANLKSVPKEGEKSLSTTGVAPVNDEENEGLRKKVAILTKEIQSLKAENDALKDKLEKIRKIA